jgi:threonine dehydratase
VEADGAEIVTVGPASTDREAKAEELLRERGLVFIPPYDDDRVIAGQGTLGLEIAEDVPDLAAVLVPIGGGGLSSGVAVAIRALHPEARILGVEPEVAADAKESLEAGRIIRWDAARTGSTIADGVRSQAIGRRPFAHLSKLLDGVVTVSEWQIAAGVRAIAEEVRLVAEPSGALAPAAARYRAPEAGLASLEGTVVAVVSGGNVDPVRYRELLESPLAG